MCRANKTTKKQTNQQNREAGKQIAKINVRRGEAEAAAATKTQQKEEDSKKEETKIGIGIEEVPLMNQTEVSKCRWVTINRGVDAHKEIVL